MAVKFEGNIVTHIRLTVPLVGFSIGTIFWQYGDGFISQDKTTIATNAQVLNFLTLGSIEPYNPAPESEWQDGRIASHRRFPNRRVLVINTTSVSVNQLRALVERDEIVIKHLIFDRDGNGDTKRIAVPIQVGFDSDGGTILPAWVTNNYPGRITHILTWHEAKRHYQTSNAFLLDGSVPEEDINVVASDRNITGRQVYNYLRGIS